MSLDELRKEIDAVDDVILHAFSERMDIARRIGEYKKERGLPILDSGREDEKLSRLAAKLPPELEQYGYSLYSMLFDLSRSYQSFAEPGRGELYNEIRNAMDTTPQLFPELADVVCQGVPGAYSQIACNRMFKRPNITYVGNFNDVFNAIESGRCQYGVLPVENSTAGSVTKVYDLMRKHNFRIVRSCRQKISHSLLACKGTKLEDIKEIFSHQQAINQSSVFLRSLPPHVKVTAVENTAIAAKMVAESGRNDIAAIASHSCIELYGLECVQADIQDQSNNYTRFICISRNLEVYPGADKTSVMVVLPHRPGALYKLLSRFYSLGINLVKLESRPIPEREFEFMFYFDLECSVYSDDFERLLNDLPAMCEEHQYLGSYREVI